jgi:hypothetical protein
MFHYTVRLIAAACVGFAAFYMAVQALDSVGRIDTLTVQRVEELYRHILSPLGDFDPIEHRTMWVVLGLILTQGVVLYLWTRNRQYTGDHRTDPLARDASLASGLLVSRPTPTRDPSYAVAADEPIHSASAALPAAKDEYARLLTLLKRRNPHA